VERFPSLSEQPWYPDLTARDNVLLSPHVAGWTTESYFKLADVEIQIFIIRNLTNACPISFAMEIVFLVV